VASSFVCIGISHKQAPIQVREQLSVPADTLHARLAELKALPGIQETLLLSTCNRLEIWAAADTSNAGADLLNSLGPIAAPHAFIHKDDAALRHLFRVASSLDSMVVGEAQILGQVKDAAAHATEAGVFGKQLNRALARATTAAKRVRTETSIARGAVSVSSVAIELAAKVLGDLTGKVPLLLGAGEMALLAARELRGVGATEFLVANRSIERAEEMVKETGGRAVPFSELNSLLERADVVICSTGAREPIITKEQMAKVVKARRFRPIFFVDLSLPRNVAPQVNDLDGCYVYDLDDLEQVANQNRDLRRAEVDKAELIVEEELKALLAELKERTGAPALARLRSKAQEIADAEVERLLSQLGPLNEKQQRSVKAMASAMVNKLLHTPTAKLREETAKGDGPVPRSLADAAAELFGLDLSAPDPHAHDAHGKGEHKQDKHDPHGKGHPAAAAAAAAAEKAQQAVPASASATPQPAQGNNAPDATPVPDPSQAKGA
jgi:glutamyl-tRNA reductase